MRLGQQILIALGANLPSAAGGPAQTLRAALAALPAQGMQVAQVSRFYATPCFPAGAGPDYVNACAVLASDLAPQGVLAALHAVEASLGRTRQVRWGARSLDLDLLAVGEKILPDLAGYAAWRDLPARTQRTATPDRLILPHPRLHERGFVLVPLADVAPDWCHPVSGLTVRDMLARLPAEARAEVKPF